MNYKSLRCVVLAIVFSPAMSSAADRPNVVLIVCDDLNTDIGHLGGHPQARTLILSAVNDKGVGGGARNFRNLSFRFIEGG